MPDPKTPNWQQEIQRRLAHLRLEPLRERAIVEELAQHLEDGYAELLAGGATAAEAERLTRAELRGSAALARELRRGNRQHQPDPITDVTHQRNNIVVRQPLCAGGTADISRWCRRQP